MYISENKKIVMDDEAYTASDGTKYPSNFPKGEISSLRKVTETAPPTDASLVVTGFHIDDSFVQVWDTRAKTSLESKAEHNAAIQAQIDALEVSVTPRMLREAAIGSTAKGLGQNKDKTAKEFIADIDAQIKALVKTKV